MNQNFLLYSCLCSRGPLLSLFSSLPLATWSLFCGEDVGYSVSQFSEVKCVNDRIPLGTKGPGSP